MARKPSPWWWEDEKGWYVNHRGKRHPLGKHPENAPAPKKSNRTGRWNAPPEIETAFRNLLGGEAPANSESVVSVLDDFISWCTKERAAKTVARYVELIQDFVKAKADGLPFGALDVSKLTSKHVTQWLALRPTWGPTTRRNAITVIQRGFNWAVKNRGLARNPIKGMEKPTGKKRTDLVTPDEFEKLLAAIPDQRFRDLLIVSYESGGRPFEVKDLEARHLQLDKQRAVISAEEAKGRKNTRIVYIPTERSMEVVRRLAEQFPEGPLFRNRLGRKFTAMAVKCRFEDLDHVLGRRVTHYSLRHSRITDWLLSGVDSHVVAKLSGHQDSKMVDTTYSHVQDDYAYMLKNAKKKTGDKKRKK